MHDKQIRRRRAVLALLVAVSLILLTDYFGGSASSPLHQVQRGIATVLSPLQAGASTVLSPIRNAASYVSSVFTAKSELTTLQGRYNQLVGEYARVQYEGILYRQAQQLLGLDKSYNLASYGPVTGRLIGEDPSLWYETITVDRGSSSGVSIYDPVVGPGGLVGDVTQVTPNASVVSLITSSKFSVGAMIENESGAAGLIEPQVGDPNALTLIDLPPNSNVSFNQLVVTSGFRDPHDPAIQSFAPPGIPIGTVSSTNPQNSVLTNQEEQVTPLADLQHLTLVQILTRPHGG
ncbi:rod shape-determining protein MreC [Conexibacter sp. S30A1]|uniref:rod shape-determining protein MreC n=1 Tax=Conexibacter sp. S30A1 TaxID=2937800 RepID=UPI00200D11AE|nr:rod shape-determining protein MreC [Conexibacter sp. S30A1]